MSVQVGRIHVSRPTCRTCIDNGRGSASHASSACSGRLIGVSNVNTSNNVSSHVCCTSSNVTGMDRGPSGGFNGVPANFGRPSVIPSVHSSGALALHVPMAVKDKIWLSQFVDFSVLLRCLP